MSDQLQGQLRPPQFVMLYHDTIDQYQAACGPYAWSVYTYLRRRLGSKATCWPSMTNIAQSTGMSERKARECIDHLRSLGLLSIESGRQRQGARVNLYTVHDGSTADSDRHVVPIETGGNRHVVPMGNRHVVPTKNIQEEEDTTEKNIQPSGADAPRAQNGRKRTPNDDMWDAFAETLGRQPRIKSEKGKWAGAIKELIEAGVDAAQVPNLVDRYRRHYGADTECNPRAVANNLSAIEAPVPTNRHGPGDDPASQLRPTANGYEGGRFGEYFTR